MEGLPKKAKVDKERLTGENILLCLKRLGLPPDLRKHILKNYLQPLFVKKSIWISDDRKYFHLCHEPAEGYSEYCYELYEKRFYAYTLSKQRHKNVWTRSHNYYDSMEEACEKFVRFPNSTRVLGNSMLHFLTSMHMPVERKFIFGADEIKTI